jgi:hypothetical protein
MACRPAFGCRRQHHFWVRDGGAVRGIDPETGHYFDDTKRYVDALPLSDLDRYKIFEGNARRVFPRLAAKMLR